MLVEELPVAEKITKNGNYCAVMFNDVASRPWPWPWLRPLSLHCPSMMGASHKSVKADITVVFNQSINQSINESSNQSMNHSVTIFSGTSP